MGVFGQAILVASRLGAYSRVAWELLVESGNQSGAVGPESSPLARYCDALKALMRHSILQRVEVRRRRHLSTSVVCMKRFAKRARFAPTRLCCRVSSRVNTRWHLL